MLSPLSAPPRVITQEEHDASTSATPHQFDRNPPILRFHDEQVHVALSPTQGGFEHWSGKVVGTLWVTEAAVSFLPADGSSGWTLEYPSLTLHALTPSTPEDPAHVYCQVDESDNKTMENGTEANGDGEEDETATGADEYTPMREVRIYLPDAKLQPLFSALSQCSALHLSQLPADQGNSFFGFGNMDDGPDDDEDDGEWDDVENGDGDGPEGDGGRDTTPTAAAGEDAGQDQVDRFLDMVDWGNVKKPAEWEGQHGEFDDAEE